MKYKIRMSLILSLAVLVFISFQNCGQAGFQAQKGDLSDLGSLGSAACESLLKQTYAKTYFPLLSVSCNRCHSNAHGSSDLDVSFRGFMTKGVTLIDYKATHPHGDNGIDLTNQIASLKSDWDQGQNDYTACLANASSGDATQGYKIKLNSKIIPNIAATETNQSQWKPIEWDLSSEVPANQGGQFQAYLKVEARYFLQDKTVSGLEFRNPTLRLKSTGQNIQLSGLNLYLENELQSNVTTYANITGIANSTSETALAAGAANALAYNPSVNANTLVAFEIQNIRFTTEGGSTGGDSSGGTGGGTAVTYTQLASRDTSVGVFRAACFSCHSGATPSAGFDMTVYTNARDRSSTILSRINSTTKPMPPTGPLSQAQRDLIGRWVNAGTPQ